MSSKHRYAAALSLVVVCGLVAVSGCAGGGGSPPASSSTAASRTTSSGTTTSAPRASTTTTASSTTTPVEIPEAARAHTEAGAEAFVKFFVEQSNVASMTADTSILPPLSDPSCKSCSALQHEVADLKARGHHYLTEPVRISQVTAIGGAPAGQQFVRLQLIQNLADVVDASGKKVSTDPETRLARTTSLKWTGDRWLVFGIA